jgi:hypothetical protein
LESDYNPNRNSNPIAVETPDLSTAPLKLKFSPNFAPFFTPIFRASTFTIPKRSDPNGRMRRPDQAPPLSFDKLKCSGNGFTAFGHHRESQSTIATELGIQPRRTPGGRVSKRRYPEQSTTWWHAQVLLYGLKCPTYDVVEMKRVLATALNETGLRVPVDLARQEELSNEQYKVANEEFQLAKYNAMPSDVGKAVYDAVRFFRELEAQGGVKQLDDLEDYEQLELHEFAQHMGLFSEIAGNRRHRTLVIGKNREEVSQAAERLRQTQPHQRTYDLQLPPPGPLDGCYYDDGWEEEDFELESSEEEGMNEDEEGDEEEGEDEEEEVEDGEQFDENYHDIARAWILEFLEVPRAPACSQLTGCHPLGHRRTHSC